MSVEQPIERASRARPLADAPVDALLARADELTRRWAIALLRSRPLGAMTEIPLERLAREGPSLCEQIARALASEEALDRLMYAAARSGGERRSPPAPSSLLPSADARSVVEDFDALRAIVWEAVLEELREPSARLVADLADRLACVCSAALATMLERLQLGSRERAEPPAAGPRTRERALYDAAPPARGRRGAVLIDELDDVPLPLASGEQEREQRLARVAAGGAGGGAAPRRPATAPPTREPATAPSAPEQAAPARGRARPWDTPLASEQEAQSASRAGESAASAAGSDSSPAPEMRIRRIAGSPLDDAG